MPLSIEFIEVDVSELAPPEPMTVILNHLSQMTQYQSLRIKHSRQPFPLYEKLKEAGFSYHCIEHGLNEFELFVFYQSSQNLFKKTLSTIDIKRGNN